MAGRWLEAVQPGHCHSAAVAGPVPAQGVNPSSTAQSQRLHRLRSVIVLDMKLRLSLARIDLGGRVQSGDRTFVRFAALNRDDPSRYSGATTLGYSAETSRAGP